MNNLPKKTKQVDYEVLPAEKKNSNSLVTYNPLVAYLREIKEFPKLSEDEEKALALKYYEHQDLKMAYKLVSANLWLVVKIARKYERMAKSIMDLIQEGNIGLMEAVRKFDPHQGARLPTYAGWWIKAYMIRYILANWRMVKIGTTQAQKKLFFNLNKEKLKLEQQGFATTTKLLAEKLDVKESEVIEMEQRLGLPELSFDAPISGEDNESSSLHNVISDQHEDPETSLINLELINNLNQALEIFKDTLSEKQIAIFDDRLVAEKKKTLQELADRFGISVEAIRQNENTIKKNLKKFMLEKYPNIEF